MEPIRANNSICSSTKFPKLELPFYGQIALGNMTQWEFAISNNGKTIYISVINKNISGVFDINSYATSERVHMVLPEIMLGDAANIADLLNSQLGHKGELQGYYYPRLLEEGTYDDRI
jgi:hypothetical protein